MRNQLKSIRALQQKKYRDEAGLFLAEGHKTITDLLSAFPLRTLLYNPQSYTLQEIRRLPIPAAAQVLEVTQTELEQLSSLRTPQGMIAVFEQPMRQDDSLQQLPQDQLVLVLDDVQDPGNLGTIIRTADWFGVRHIVCSKHTADCYSPKVVQATMGALARVRLHYTDLTVWLPTLPADVPVYGTLLDGKNIYEQRLTASGVLIMGNEGNGISQTVRECITRPLFIPSYPPNEPTSESLNVAIATALTLAEFRRIAL